ncbi:MAG: thiosulfohydrolase SoxB [Acetobacteraceae bacterium]|nr:thiosulfohydrolase SoxB [Acetobacteraceae bacterium]
MITRRDFWAAGAALASVGTVSRAAATQAITQDNLLAFTPLGQVTLLHVTDLHAQLLPMNFREPSVNIGVGEAHGRPPHLSDGAFRKFFAIADGSPDAFALTSDDFVALAREYGRMGGLDRIATLVNAIRAERGADRVALLDGGDTWQGSWTSLQTKGADMVACMARLQPDAMVGHFEFTYGQDRVLELAKAQDFPFLASNILDEWKEPVFPASRMITRGGVNIAIIGQAFPFTPIANPRWMMPDWNFGIQEELLRANVAAARAKGATVVVLLSHNGYDVDRKLAVRVAGIDVILSGHTHDAMPRPELIGSTILVASGCNGKFLSRIDLDVQGGKVAGWRYKLIPVFADAITPDPAMSAEIAKQRAPYAADLSKVLGRTQGLLYRRGNAHGSFDDLICDAMLAERDAEIALSPGFRWGPSLLPGQDITADDVYNATAITYPACYRTTMSGAQLRDVLEDVADNLFNPDPYYQQGGDMVRVGGVGYTLNPNAAIGKRISDMVLLRTGAAIDAARLYRVAGWASISQATEGPPIWDVVGAHLRNHPEVRPRDHSNVKLITT